MFVVGIGTLKSLITSLLAAHHGLFQALSLLPKLLQLIFDVLDTSLCCGYLHHEPSLALPQSGVLLLEIGDLSRFADHS